MLEYRYFSGIVALDMIVSKRGEMDGDCWDGDGSNDRGGAIGQNGQTTAVESAGSWLAGGCWSDSRWLDLVE